jgi:hypothetical protein
MAVGIRPGEDQHRIGDRKQAECEDQAGKSNQDQGIFPVTDMYIQIKQIG